MNILQKIQQAITGNSPGKTAQTAAQGAGILALTRPTPQPYAAFNQRLAMRPLAHPMPYSPPMQPQTTHPAPVEQVVNTGQDQLRFGVRPMYGNYQQPFGNQENVLQQGGYNPQTSLYGGLTQGPGAWRNIRGY